KAGASETATRATISNTRRMSKIIALLARGDVNSVLVSASVRQAAEFAKSWRLAVIDPVVHRLQRTQVGEDVFHILVGHVLEHVIRHDHAELSGLHVTRFHRLNE